MPTDTALAPQNTDPHAEPAIDVGEDLGFQRRWWRFEAITWTIFALILVADCLGLFGEGWLAHRRIQLPNSALDIRYEGIVRASTPTKVTVRFDQNQLPPANAVQLFVSNSLIDDLGNQRIAPQPAVSAVGHDGITYVFPWTGAESSVLFSMQPSKPGIVHFSMHVPGHAPVTVRVLVLP